MIATLAVYAVWEPYWREVVRFELHHRDIPPAWDGARIVFLTDLHYHPPAEEAFVRQVVEEANALHPDLILLGGDYITQSAEYIEPCFRELARLKAPHGVYGVLGNHDNWEDAERSRRAMADAGIHLIANNAVWLESGGARIRLGGVGDLWTETQDLTAFRHGLADSDFTILLTHNPDYVERESAPADLVLAGHLHGGQVTCFGLWAWFLPSDYGQKYREGVIRSDTMTLIVSRGVGFLLPVRFFARPQIWEITLRR